MKQHQTTVKFDRCKMAGLILAGYKFKFFRSDYRYNITEDNYPVLRGWAWAKPNSVYWIGSYVLCTDALADAERDAGGGR